MDHNPTASSANSALKKGDRRRQALQFREGNQLAPEPVRAFQQPATLRGEISRHLVVLLILTPFLQFGWPSFSFADQKPSAEGLLSELQATFERLNRCTFECTQINFASVPAHPERDQGSSRIIIERDHDRWHIFNERTRLVKGEERRSALECLIEDHVLVAQLTGRGDLPISRRLRLSGYLDPRKSDDLPGHLGIGGCIFGIIPAFAGKPLWDVFRASATVKLDSQVVDLAGHPTRVLTAVNDSSTVSVWLDINHGSLPRKILIRGEDKGAGKQNGDAAQTRVAGSLPTEFTQLIENVEIVDCDGVPMIGRFDFFNTPLVDGKASESARSEVRVTECQLSVRGGFSPRIEIPEDMYVYVKDAPAITYVWHSGQLQKSLGNIVMPEHGKQHFQTPPDSYGFRTILIVANAVLVGIACSALLIRWFRRRS